jgi:hypothetical protein
MLVKLKAKGMDLKKEDSVAGFLGVHIEQDTVKNEICLTQKGLTQRIIKALGIGSHSGKNTLSEHGALPSNPEGDPPDANYSYYPSVIGMMLYLSGHSRPDNAHIKHTAQDAFMRRLYNIYGST